MRKHSVSIKGHRTSISLEDAFWTELASIAHNQNRSVASIVTEIDKHRETGLSSAIRLFVLAELKQNAAACKTVATPAEI